MVKEQSPAHASMLNSKKLDGIWEEISSDVAAAFRMTEAETVRFRNKPLAKLIGLLPFLAGCEDAERTAVSHLGTYILSFRETKHYFHANKADNVSVFERLRLGMNFKGGEEQIIERGMCLIALIMLNDYNRDIHLDEAIGKYNPVGDREIAYEQEKADLENRVRSIECPEMEKILRLDSGTQSLWGD